MKIKCLLCNADTNLQKKEFPGFQEPEVFSIYHCPSCNTSFSLPRVDASSIYNTIYKKGADVIGYERYWRYKETIKDHDNPLVFLDQAEESYWGAINAIKSSIVNKNEAKILEIGCGMGYLTYALNKAGYNSTGLDISQEAINEAQKTFGDYYVCANFFSFSEKHSNEFDVIVMTELIEHVENPTEFLLQAARLIKPEGSIIITTPNKSIYSDSVIWNTDLPPVHCWWFSEESVLHIAEQLNCDVSFVDFSEFYKKRKPVYIKRKKQLVIGPRLNKNEVPTGDTLIAANLSFLKLLKKLITKSNIYRFIKSIIQGDRMVRCGKRGDVICAIIKRKH